MVAMVGKLVDPKCEDWRLLAADDHMEQKCQRSWRRWLGKGLLAGAAAAAVADNLFELSGAEMDFVIHCITNEPIEKANIFYSV